MRIRHSVLLASAAAILVPCAAQAQDQADTAVSAEDNGDIIVTAQRRSESLQDTPLAITALTGGDLAENGVTTAADLQSQVPALQIAPQVFGNLQIFLRGVGSTANTPSGDPAIAFHMDGVYVARTTSTASLLFDIERIEVVKGPQGTLYGRNATGGSVNVITKKPDFSGVSGYGAVELGNLNLVKTEGAINVPLSNTLAARVSFATARRDGYMRAQDALAGTQGNDRADLDDAAVRAHLLWEPSSRFNMMLTGDYAHQGGAGGGEQLLPLTTGDPYVINASQDIWRDNSFANAKLEANYEFDFATLTYIGGYRYSNTDKKYEYPLSGNPGYLNFENAGWSHELRLGGETGPVNWVAGLYHFDEETSDNDLRLQITPTLWQHVMGSSYTATSSAVFGQATVSVTDALRLTGGLRYTDDKKTSLQTTQIELEDGTVVVVTAQDDTSGKWNKLNWKAGVEYDVTPDSMFYGSIGTAYKAGGNYGGTAPNDYGPENLTAYEVGLKNRFGRGVTLNLAAYWYDYTDLQITSLDSDNGTLRTVTRNAGSATIKGAEAEFAWNTYGFGKFDGSVAYTDAKYDHFVLPYGDSFTNYGSDTQTAVDYSGQRLALTPKWSFNVGYEYTFDVLGGSLKARAQTHYESGKNLDFHNFAVNYQKAYTKTDLSATYEPDNADWSLQLYVRNLEDEAVRTTSIPPIAANPIYAQAYYAPPRLYGARFQVNF